MDFLEAFGKWETITAYRVSVEEDALQSFELKLGELTDE